MYPDISWLMFIGLFGLVLLGIPVGVSLFVNAFVFGAIVFGSSTGIQLFSRISVESPNFVLAAIPLYVLMGAIMERAQLATKLFLVLRILLARVRGSLSIVTILICGVFAAASGVVGAVEIVVGLITIPAMMRAGYSKDVIAGTVCAGGSLGTLIPPSVLLVVYASVADVSAGRMFSGVLGPAGVTLVLFVAYLFLRGASGVRQHADGDNIEGHPTSFGGLLLLTVQALVPPAVLITAVLGSVIAGVASPTEAGAVGVAGALVLAAINSGGDIRKLRGCLSQTARVSGSILFIVLSGVLFATVFLALGGNTMIRGGIQAMELAPNGTVLLFLMATFVLGFFLDWIAVVLILTPICAPIIRELGVDPIWFGVLFCLALQTSYLTPPMAPSIFYLRTIAPRDISYRDMYLGVIPFVCLQLVTILIVFFAPKIVG